MHSSVRIFGCAIAALSLAACESFAPQSPPAALVSEDADTLARSTNVIVLVRTNQQANTLLVNAARRGYQLNERSNLQSLDMIMLDFERPRGVSGAVAISDMKTMEPSASAGLDHLYTFQSEAEATTDTKPTKPGPRLYAQTMLAWPKIGCIANIRIGMIDGSVDTSSPALANVEIVQKAFTTPGGGRAHGTAIADLLVGKGRLADAELYSASVIPGDDAEQRGAGVPEIIQAIDWMGTSGVQLVNISLAGPYNVILDRVVQRATNQGMILVAAVGNDGPNAAPRYPAAYRDVIAVTAIDQSRNIYAQAVHGDHVDFSAPGVDIFVNNGSSSQYLSGTSVATPFVTALVASNIARSGSLDTETARAKISADAVDLGQLGPDPVYGRGLARLSGDCQPPAVNQ